MKKKPQTLVPHEGEKLKSYVARLKAEYKYVPANADMFRPYYVEVLSIGNLNAKQQWLKTHVGEDAYYSVAGVLWYFDNDDDAIWFKLSF